MLKKSSVRIAKDRLRALVTSDRVQCKPDICEQLQGELFRTLSKYIELTPEEFQISITRTHIHIQLIGEKN